MGKEKSDQAKSDRPARGKARPEADPAIPLPEDEAGSGDDARRRIAAIPDLIRRAMAVGFSSFFTTEEAIRRALGDTLPQDWVEFASAQSERTRQEFIDRLAQEFGRIVEKVDLYEIAERLLDGRTIEVNATIKLGARGANDRNDDKASRLEITALKEAKGKR